MQKNVASQKLIVFAFDSTTNLPKSGDAANITAYVSIDYGVVTVLGDTTATEMDATNAKGYYLFDLTQAETNGNTLLFSAKSSTANIVVIGVPATVFTDPANITALTITSGGVTLADGVSHGGTLGSSTATLALKSMNVTNSTGDAVTMASTGSNGNGLKTSGNGTGAGQLNVGGATGNGTKNQGGATSGTALLNTAPGTNSAGQNNVGSGTQPGCKFTGGATGAGLQAVAGSGADIVGVLGDLDTATVGSYTIRQLLRGFASALLGKLSGGGTTTNTIRSADDTKNVIVATVDSSGNRSAITLDLT